jgi:hypothetical protein
MRLLSLFLSLFIVFSCQSPAEKTGEETAKNTQKLNPAVAEIVVFMADSVAECNTWLSKDYRVRAFFEPSDTLADYLSNTFTHDEILAFFEGIDKTTQLDLSGYLVEADISQISEIDSLKGCAASINSIAFLNPNKAVLLYTNITKTAESSQTFLLQKQSAGWQITDTLRQ